MSSDGALGVCAISDVTTIREALGAIAAGEPGMFWVYTDPTGRWCARRAGEAQEIQFPSRRAACAFVQMQAARCRSYRLLIADDDGRIAEESFNWS